MGMNPKYTPELVDKLTNVIGLGLTVKLACHVANISETAFYDWIKEYPEFKAEIESAKEKRELMLLKDVMSQGDTKDKISLLKMLYGAKYNVSNVKLSGDASNPVAINSNLGINKERLKELVKEGYTLDEIMEKL